jgi:hypothetical protein
MCLGQPTQFFVAPKLVIIDLGPSISSWFLVSSILCATRSGQVLRNRAHSYLWSPCPNSGSTQSSQQLSHKPRVDCRTCHVSTSRSSFATNSLMTQTFQSRTWALLSTRDSLKWNQIGCPYQCRPVCTCVLRRHPHTPISCCPDYGTLSRQLTAIHHPNLCTSVAG